ncbi:MAG TPA: lipid-A-disaccharide synthase [Candidatus Dormibacteraeota bacterium]|nr:lipid-A-disaccharide synthase [Candidatus Dormibacteraeota bacterium]
MPPTLLLSAGEASGDMYASRLATEIYKRADVEIFGMGGSLMRAAGVDVVTDYSEVSVLGITEILSHLPSLVRAMRRLVSEARSRRPALAILTDFPGFHLRLARKLKPLGVRNVYFVCPQFWAWRPWRVRVIRRRFARALCIFPFEEDFFGRAGVPTKFIGHPLVGMVMATSTRPQFTERHHLDPGQQIVTLLPGSRMGEISRHLPTMLAACAGLQGLQGRSYNVVVAVAPGFDLERLKPIMSPFPEAIVVQDETYNALGAADAALVCSGTATIEAALLDVPMAVVYRVTTLTATLAKPLVRTKFFSMVNLIAGRAVVRELIQDDFTPQSCAQELARLLDSAEARQELRQGLAEVRERLGPPGAIERAAEEIVALLRKAGW